MDCAAPSRRSRGESSVYRAQTGCRRGSCSSRPRARGSAAACRAGRWCWPSCAGRRRPGSARAARRWGRNRPTRKGSCRRPWRGTGCPARSKSICPPTWQQIPRSTGTSRMVCSLPSIEIVPDQLKARQAHRPAEALEIGGSAGERGIALVQVGRRRIVPGRVERRRIVDIEPVILLEARVDGHALQALFIVLVDGDVRDHAVLARGRVVPENAPAPRGVEHPPIRQDDETHRLTRAPRSA